MLQKERLITLLKHMESGKLSVDKFDMSTFRRNYCHNKGCTTYGCIAGELPALFPDDWEWNPDKPDQPRLKIKGDISNIGLSTNLCLVKFFGITKANVSRLFYTKSFLDSHEDESKSLPDEATREQATEHLKQFMQEKGIIWD